MEDNTEEIAGQDEDPNFIKYSEIHPTFRSEMTYVQRLAWWRENDISPLTVIFFPEKKIAIEHHATLRTVHQFTEQGETVRSLSIEPCNAEQFEQFEQWALKESRLKGYFKPNYLSENLIKEYWLKVALSPMPKEVLSEEIRLIDRIITDAESYPDRTGAILFLHGYNRRKLGYSPVINYEELYYSLFSNDKRERTVNDLENAERIIPELYRGWLFCEYRGFLQKQLDRLSRGEDISKPEVDTSEITADNQDTLKLPLTQKRQVIIAHYLMKYGLVVVNPQLTKEARFGILNALMGRGLSHQNTKEYLNSIDNPKDPEKVKTIPNLEAVLPYFENINIPDIVNEIKEEIAKLAKKKG
ncbi:hypothetical protein [Larkinella punicea]|uniref:Uncharacterized protein n=1 Tax=Larkinella punicea TaxID=2315727 RepID=A0A368JGR8_9BACT|nr:hypothetical protein [Larkinella punicea]RCR66859.1 hypothetical protein DUE52_25260 [Larkinella punicea]